MKALLSALAVVLALGCGSGGDDDASTAPRGVRAVVWNKEPLTGTVLAVADAGEVIAVFGADAMRVLVDGAVVASDNAAQGWKAAASIAAPDGTGTWMVAIDPEGKLHRVRADGRAEDLSARFDLTDVALTGVADAGAGSVLFAFEGGVALSDGKQVRRFDVGRAARLAGGGGRFAVLDEGVVRVFEDSGAGAAFAVPGAVAVALGSGGEVFVATSETVYAEQKGSLRAMLRPDAGRTRGMVASDKTLWILAGGELFALDGATQARTSAASIPDDAQLIASRSGDVWVLTGGALRRYTLDGGQIGTAEAWKAGIEPLFTRSCSSCHRAGGSAGIDLSTYEAWVARRSALLTRVVIERTMPPAGPPASATTLTDEEREAIRAFIEGH